MTNKFKFAPKCRPNQRRPDQLPCNSFNLVLGDRGDRGPKTMINHAWRMMTELSLEPWNIRGIGIVFDLKQEAQDTREIHEIWEKRRSERSAEAAKHRNGFSGYLIFTN